MTAKWTLSDPEVENGSPNHAAPQASRRSKDVPGDALGNAIGRAWTREVEEILGSPDMMRGEEFGLLLGVTPQAVGKWRRQGLVLGLQGLTRTFRYPKWQITDDGQLLPGLKEVTGELGEPWIVYRFLLQNHPRLKGKTALECLKAGHIEDVLETARGIVQGTFS